jgi:hypothetical protein
MLRRRGCVCLTFIVCRYLVPVLKISGSCYFVCFRLDPMGQGRCNAGWDDGCFSCEPVSICFLKRSFHACNTACIVISSSSCHPIYIPCSLRILAVSSYDSLITPRFPFSDVFGTFLVQIDLCIYIERTGLLPYSFSSLRQTEISQASTSAVKSS